ncbi:hypothetical protein COO91_02384 [Nostoc flagelliforme CCNUN1]|uniref:Uncharacterized protein n=1 Tax=Nostoc flagelliforme CCNUN1 TaxID=2038116 RepID=A0A2K8SLZ4_9NOSO|nr:hypothetical protein COO91_02384 [Nostoc flagelliforme CCNUN1]
MANNAGYKLNFIRTIFGSISVLQKCLLKNPKSNSFSL